MNNSRRHAIALSIVFASFAAQLLTLGSVGEIPPWLLLYPAVFSAALLTGLAGGLSATVVATILGWYFFVPPRYNFMFTDFRQIFSVTVFAATGVAFAVFSQRLRDASEKKAIAQTDAKLRAVLDFGADAIMVANTDSRLIYANQQAGKLLGYGQEELVGLSVADIAPGEDGDSWLARFPDMLRAGHLGAEVFLRRQDGQRVPVEINAIQLPDGTYYAACRDITQRRQAAEALREANERLTRVLEVETVGVMFWDLNTGCLADANDTFLDLMGYSRSDVAAGQLTWQKLTPPEYHDVSLAEVEKFLATGRVGPYEKEYLRKDGTRNWFVFAGSTLGNNTCVEFCVDISERKRAEKAMRDSEERLRRVSDNANVGLTRCSRDLIYLSANPAYGTIAGKPLDRIVGHPIAGVIGAEAMETIRPYIERVLRGEKVTHESKVSFPGAGQRYLHASYTPDTDAEGRIVGWVASITDVTEHKQAELAMREAALRTRSLLDNLPQLIWQKDADSVYVDCNRAYARALGTTPECVIGKTDLDFYCAELAEKYRADDRRIMACGTQETLEERWGVADTERLLQTTKVPLIDPERKVLGTLGIAEDITERRRSEERIRELSQAVEQSPESILITDLAARIQYVNNAFVQATGYSREEILGKNPRILQSGGTPPESYAALWHALAQGQTWTGELCNRRRDGSEYVDFAIISPMRDADGRVSHYVAVQEDITEKKRLGEELDQHRHHLEELVEERTAEANAARAQAEAANLAKSSFLANMSHEIRTPMNGVLGMAGLLRRTGITERQADYLDKIEASGKHLLAIINDILDLSKIEAGKLHLDPQDFPLTDMLQDVLAIVDIKAKSKGLRLRVEASSAPRSLRGDRVRLAQALVNFLGNAIKFTHEGGITLACLKLGETDSGYLMRFEVRDTGIGMTAEQQQRIFDPFEQADNTTTREYGGTGLGLAITRRIAQIMGGEVGVESELGRGSTFWLTVPLDKGPEATTGAAARSWESDEDLLRQRHGGRRILLVEDDPINREVASLLCTEVGLAVDTAANGAEAIDMVETGEHALILMDVHMPVMDGMAATRAIRQLAGRQAVPILALTASAFAEDREKCFAAGMNDFIAKPFEPAEFFRMILKWLERQRP